MSLTQLLLVLIKKKSVIGNLFFIGILLFLLLRSPCKISKFHNPSCFLSGRKVRASERKKEDNAKYYGHFGAGARTSLGPKLQNYKTLVGG